ncbi:hypothetical protein NQD34_005639 [Periophthalmus magnuspinnatus]|nr:hypothetical protein NQD34_005639 [Periophthalmus magnuspinnatus]
MMPAETLPASARRPVGTVVTSTPPRLRPKAPVAPELYRRRQGGPKQSAVERLEADKAKYVKSQVALSKQQPVRPLEVSRAVLSCSALQPMKLSPHPKTPITAKTKETKPPITAKTKETKPPITAKTKETKPPVTAKSKESLQLDLEHLSNLISDVSDGPRADDTKPPQTVSPQKKPTPPPPSPRPDWSSPAKVRLKAPPGEDSGPAPPAAGTVRRVDVLPQAGSARPR